MWYLVLIAIAVVIIVVVVAYSNSGSQSHARRSVFRSDDTQVRRPDLADEWHSLHHDADGTPYGAMDAEFEDWG